MHWRGGISFVHWRGTARAKFGRAANASVPAFGVNKHCGTFGCGQLNALVHHYAEQCANGLDAIANQDNSRRLSH
jgi:hypothetical protein